MRTGEFINEIVKASPEGLIFLSELVYTSCACGASEPHGLTALSSMNLSPLHGMASATSSFADI